MPDKSRNLLTRLRQFNNDLNKILEDKKYKSFTFEVTLTEGCNWNCEYCFEGNVKKTSKKNRLTENPQVLLNTIDKILNGKWFKEKFDRMNIDFWGGEPTLNLPLMKIILDHYENDERVSFFLYTNGSRINKLIPLIQDLKDKPALSKEKILVQISYDGNPIHDMRRLDCAGNATSNIAKKAMGALFSHQIPFHLKSTLMPKDFIHMPEAWDDINELRKMYGNRVNYSPTIDYFTVDFNEQYYKDLEQSLLKIAKKELENNKTVENFTFAWFGRENKVACGSGKYMCAVDINGNVHFCHGCIYGDHMRFANIYKDDKIFKGIARNNEMLKDSVYDLECEKCVATTCLRCNYLKYLNSKKSKFIDRFYDFKSQPDLCKYYQLAGKIDRAVREIAWRKK